MHIQVNFDNGLSIASKDQNFEEAVKDAVESPEGVETEMTEEQAAQEIIEVLQGLTDKLDEGIEDFGPFKLMSEEGHVCFIDMSKVSMVRIVGGYEFAMQAAEFGEKLIAAEAEKSQPDDGYQATLDSGDMAEAVGEAAEAMKDYAEAIT